MNIHIYHLSWIHWYSGSLSVSSQISAWVTGKMWICWIWIIIIDFTWFCIGHRIFRQEIDICMISGFCVSFIIFETSNSFHTLNSLVQKTLSNVRNHLHVNHQSFHHLYDLMGTDRLHWITFSIHKNVIHRFSLQLVFPKKNVAFFRLNPFFSNRSSLSVILLLSAYGTGRCVKNFGTEFSFSFKDHL